MKDFHDVILMIRKPNLLKINPLKEAVNQVFHHKKLEKKFPIEFDDVSYQRLEEYWKQHQRGLRKLAKDLKLPGNPDRNWPDHSHRSKQASKRRIIKAITGF